MARLSVSPAYQMTLMTQSGTRLCGFRCKASLLLRQVLLVRKLFRAQDVFFSSSFGQTAKKQNKTKQQAEWLVDYLWHRLCILILSLIHI